MLQTGSLELSCPSVSDLVFAESPRLLCNMKTFAGLQLCSLLTSTQVRMPRLSYSVILLEHAALPRSAFWFYRRKGVHFQGICGVNVSVASFLSSLHICNIPAVSCILENSCGWRDTTWTSNWCFSCPLPLRGDENIFCWCDKGLTGHLANAVPLFSVLLIRPLLGPPPHL